MIDEDALDPVNRLEGVISDLLTVSRFGTAATGSTRREHRYHSGDKCRSARGSAQILEVECVELQSEAGACRFWRKTSYSQSRRAAWRPAWNRVEAPRMSMTRAILR